MRQYAFQISIHGVPWNSAKKRYAFHYITLLPLIHDEVFRNAHNCFQKTLIGEIDLLFVKNPACFND